MCERSQTDITRMVIHHGRGRKLLRPSSSLCWSETVSVRSYLSSAGPAPGAWIGRWNPWWTVFPGHRREARIRKERPRSRRARSFPRWENSGLSAEDPGSFARRRYRSSGLGRPPPGIPSKGSWGLCVGGEYVGALGAQSREEFRWVSGRGWGGGSIGLRACSCTISSERPISICSPPGHRRDDQPGPHSGIEGRCSPSANAGGDPVGRGTD